MNFTRDNVSTTRTVSYRLEDDFPKWTIKRPGSYAPGHEHLSEDLMGVERVVFSFGMSVGQWVLRDVVLTLTQGTGPDRRTLRHPINEHTMDGMPWWLMKLAASAAQEPWH